jgi:hypothetical protein
MQVVVVVVQTQPLGRGAQVAAGKAAKEIPARDKLLAQAILAVAAVVQVDFRQQSLAATAALASSSSATSAHSAALAVQLHLPVVTPSTPLHRPALTQHKDSKWHISQK